MTEAIHVSAPDIDAAPAPIQGLRYGVGLSLALWAIIAVAVWIA